MPLFTRLSSSPPRHRDKSDEGLLPLLSSELLPVDRGAWLSVPVLGEVGWVLHHSVVMVEVGGAVSGLDPAPLLLCRSKAVPMSGQGIQRKNWR